MHRANHSLTKNSEYLDTHGKFPLYGSPSTLMDENLLHGLILITTTHPACIYNIEHLRQNNN